MWPGDSATQNWPTTTCFSAGHSGPAGMLACHNSSSGIEFSAVFPQLFVSFSRGGPFVLLHLLLVGKDTENSMARYSAFLGRHVEVQYRAGDILLPASGIFVADSGRSIFLEQNFEQHGQHKHFRWEIPYQCLVRIIEKPNEGAGVDAASSPANRTSAAEAPEPSKSGNEPLSAAAAASSVGPGFIPFPHNPKTA